MQTFLQKNAFLPQNYAKPYEIHVYFAEKRDSSSQAPRHPYSLPTAS